MIQIVVEVSRLFCKYISCCKFLSIFAKFFFSPKGFDRNRPQNMNNRGRGGNFGQRGFYNERDQRQSFDRSPRGGFNDRGYNNDRGGGGGFGGGRGGNGGYNDRERSSFGGGNRYRNYNSGSRDMKPRSGPPFEEFKEPSEEDAANRPKLKLLPRSKTQPVNDLAETKDRVEIFGGAKPRDEKAYEEKKRRESEKSGNKLYKPTIYVHNLN